jgi:hypothetical protein
MEETLLLFSMRSWAVAISAEECEKLTCAESPMVPSEAIIATVEESCTPTTPWLANMTDCALESRATPVAPMSAHGFKDPMLSELAIIEEF